MISLPREKIHKKLEIGATNQEVCLLDLEQNSTMLGEGHSTMRPPLFNDTNYSYQRTRIKLFIQANNYEVWRMITNSPSIPKKRVDGAIVAKKEYEWDEVDIKIV